MHKKTEENRRNRMTGYTGNLTMAQMDEQLKEQRIIISEMKQTQIRAELAYASLYKKYVQAIHEKSLIQAEAVKAKEELATLINSRSFRITKPLRSIMRVIRRWIK